MKHIKLFSLFESESLGNDVDLGVLFESPKWKALAEAIGMVKNTKFETIPDQAKITAEKIYGITMPDDNTSNSLQFSQAERTRAGGKAVFFKESEDFEYLKKFIVKSISYRKDTTPAVLYLDSVLVLVCGKNKESISLRLHSKDDRRDPVTDVKGAGIKTGIRFDTLIDSKDVASVEAIAAKALIDHSISLNKELFKKEHSGRPQTLEQYDLFCDIVSGMIASASGHPEFGPGEDRKKEIHDFILDSGDHRVMNFAKKYYPDLWEEMQASTGGAAETIADLTELGF